MKKMMMAVALMMVSTIIFAQQRPSHEGKKKGLDRRSEFMKKELLLTDDQYTKVKMMNESFAQKFSAIRKDTAMSQGKAHSQFKKLKEDHKTQLRSILNDPQWAKWTAMNERHKGGHRKTNDHRRHEHRGYDRDRENKG